ncbi:ABC1 kinase family protein [Marivita hallyeonensis]|uniref:Predicted unusual protein kinase regulating ubiquinone biosynthesis, AarF/ABC1/UbiB family n=1 Tax=Marivita hallyeonensis TaxID=996342 RepID=A0A1M5NB44_9RHOB|nr:AarF/ABC1/UbiB kinase family protein [Marivita hallyeonensis]SHG86836.1 Predicted unusual protein kinase regulating ubiquinone biosynthesis, AarF/ABC1/UbiB family [Marivita hallyeonensis]
MSDTPDPRARAVPTGRANRAARMGGLTAGLIGSAAAEGARHLLRGQRPSPRDMFLTPSNAHRLTQQLSQMRGAAMKMGQLLSLEAGDLLTPELAAVLRPLQSQAHFMPPSQLKKVLSAAWGSDFTKRFKRFDVRPIAAASIGQVHRAQTRDGRDLAIKVQYPGIRDSIDSDIRNLAGLMRLSGMVPKGLDLASLLEDARRQLHEEADYVQEAAYLAEFGQLLSDDPTCVVPGCQADFSTADILAMDFVPSQPIDTLDDADAATRDDVARRLIALMMREVFEFGLVQSDPNFANFRWQPETARLVLLDFGATRRLDASLIARSRAMLQPALENDLAGLADALRDLGLLTDALPEAVQAEILDMVATANGPMLSPDGFDFGDTTLVADLRDRGMALGRDRSIQHIPPTEVLYLQRKAAGLFLLATRLRAKVNLRELFDMHV